MSINQKLDPARGPVHRMSLAEFRTLVDEQPLSPAERRLIVDQARTLVDNVYAHLPQKRSMYGIDASQQLRLLQRRERWLDEGAFHRELLRVFDGLRDMHTTYVPPEPRRGWVLLGFTLERYWDREDHQWHFLVSKSGSGEYRKAIPIGVEVTHWNGMPIEVAVRQNAEAEAGGNPAARFARGLESLTARNVALSPLPAEDWVYIDYRYPGTEKTGSCRAEWWVERAPVLPPDANGGGASARARGISLRTDLARQLRSELLRDLSDDPAVVIATPLDREVKARIVTNGNGDKVAHLRITTFHTEKTDVPGFLAEIARLLVLLPRDGLILDVRGNGGGYVEVAEGLLQLLTDRAVVPETTQFINSPTTYDLCGRSADLLPWRPSIAESGDTGAQFSAAFPLSRLSRPAESYPGPVILVTDALSYSATDVLAAGFQDNNLGTVLGVDASTGAGGADVWTLGLLRQVWPAGPFQQLPGDARLTVALRRSLRVGLQHGRLVEDFGVRPEVRYQMTKRDLLERNVDLIAFCTRILREQVGRPWPRPSPQERWWQRAGRAIWPFRPR